MKSWDGRLQPSCEDRIASGRPQRSGHGRIKETVTGNISAIAGRHNHVINNALGEIAKLESDFVPLNFD